MTKKKFLKVFAHFIVEQYGERCPDFEANCAICTMWKLHELADAIIMDDDEEESEAARERERCAIIAEEYYGYCGGSEAPRRHGETIAAAIRAGEKAK